MIMPPDHPFSLASSSLKHSLLVQFCILHVAHAYAWNSCMMLHPHLRVTIVSDIRASLSYSQLWVANLTHKYSFGKFPYPFLILNLQSFSFLSFFILFLSKFFNFISQLPSWFSLLSPSGCFRCKLGNGINSLVFNGLFISNQVFHQVTTHSTPHSS